MRTAFLFLRPVNVRIANPAHFMAQKLLIYKRRDRRFRTKDILYLNDTIELFGSSLETLNREWNNGGWRLLHENAVADVESGADSFLAQSQMKLGERRRRGRARAYWRRYPAIVPSWSQNSVQKIVMMASS